MYRNIKYALKFKIDIGTVENLLPLAVCLSPKDKMNTVQRIKAFVIKNKSVESVLICVLKKMPCPKS